ncbi:hypothetical protein [Streptacidiphilus sp. PAMC 29251]
MIADGTGMMAQAALAEELREQASSFVNQHVDVWVAVEDDGTLVLAAADPVLVFQAAADWLGEEAAYQVVDARWERRAVEPDQALRLTLRRAAAGAEAPRTAD